MAEVPLRDYFEARLVELSRRLDDGDRALREHITAQVDQIAVALETAQREMAAEAAASEKAVLKAEAATEKRFEAANEWRQQSNDRERAAADQTAKLVNNFLPRETADALLAVLHRELAELRRQQADLAERFGRIA